MTRKMLVNAHDSRETRIATIHDSRLDGFQISYNDRNVSIGNVYLGKVARVEPGLQAAFVSYGAERQGFLPFSEIHPDYYRSSKQANADGSAHGIQDVISEGQLVMVQVNKEWPGSRKGASLSTRITLAGRYCILMPNSMRGGGVSRKISNHAERTRLQEILDDMPLPEGMSLIVRTSAEKQDKAQLLQDFKALLKLWESIRNATQGGEAPLFLYEDSKIIMQAIRDMYDDDMDEILVDDEDCLEEVKDWLRLFAPGHENKVNYYDSSTGGGLFSRYGIEDELIGLYEPKCDLPSGGHIVIQPTEALTVIDVNSGRATQQSNIEQTALQINLEAADEIARRVILCEIAGIIVIDFIDMESSQHRARVESRVRELLLQSRARVQVNRITTFGLLELSRQRLRPSFFDLTADRCPHCDGRGMVRAKGIMSAHIVRRLESEAIKMQKKGDDAGERKITLSVRPEIALSILNEARRDLRRIENHYEVEIEIIPIYESHGIALDFYTFGEFKGVSDERDRDYGTADHRSQRRQQRSHHNNRSSQRHRGNRGGRDKNRSPRRYQRAGAKQQARELSIKDKLFGLFR